jgi:GxxExxY protein
MHDIKSLCDQIGQTAYEIHVFHGHGYFEKIYENALVHRLRKAGLNVKQQHPTQVLDEDGTPLGDYLVAVIVEDELLIESKAVRAISSEHEAQILGYLRSSRLNHGLLINFGSYKFEIRKYIGRE